MPLPLVLELQQLAQTSSTDVLELLRRAKVVASKLKLDDFNEWFEHELNGYPEPTKVPGYRRVPSRLMIRNRFQGLIPAVFEGGPLADHFATMPMFQAIAEIAHIVTTLKGGKLECSLSDEEVRVLVSADPRLKRVEPVRIINKPSVVAILDAVRNRILQWSLELEQKGILGADMTFTKDEQKAASQITIHNYGSLGSVVQGAGSTVTTAQDSAGAQMNVATGSSRIEKRLGDAIEVVRKMDAQTATAIERLAEAIRGSNVPEAARAEATDVLTVVAEQSALAEAERMPKTILVPVLDKARSSLSVTADLAQVWGTWGPKIAEWLGVLLG